MRTFWILTCTKHIEDQKWRFLIAEGRRLLKFILTPTHSHSHVLTHTHNHSTHTAPCPLVYVYAISHIYSESTVMSLDWNLQFLGFKNWGLCVSLSLFSNFSSLHSSLENDLRDVGITTTQTLCHKLPPNPKVMNNARGCLMWSSNAHISYHARKRCTDVRYTYISLHFMYFLPGCLQVVDPFSCGSFCWSSLQTSRASRSSAGQETAGSSNSPTPTRWEVARALSTVLMGDRHRVKLQNKTSIRSHNTAFVWLETQIWIKRSAGQDWASTGNCMCRFLLDYKQSSHWAYSSGRMEMNHL